ncbi:hypothetical protein O5477_26530, partial [Escherichia coli]|nr:hypothetical protein [Escherichia coli]
ISIDNEGNITEQEWEKLFNGEIDCLVSDHSPCPPEMKAGNIMKAWGGIAGLQSCMDVTGVRSWRVKERDVPQRILVLGARGLLGQQLGDRRSL